MSFTAHVATNINTRITYVAQTILDVLLQIHSVSTGQKLPKLFCLIEQNV